MTIRPQDIFGGTGSIVDSIGGRKNYMIDGNFDFWDEGSGPFTTNGYMATMWRQSAQVGIMSSTRQPFTVGQTDVPGNPSYYASFDVGANSGSGDWANVGTSIEDVTRLAGETVTFSFWARANSSGKKLLIDMVQDFGPAGDADVEDIGVTEVPITTSWTKYSITVDIPSILGKTLDSLQTTRLFVRFTFSAGSAFQTPTNSLGNQSGIFDIAQVQLEKGSLATDFEYRSYGEEQALVRRYYRECFTYWGMTTTSASTLRLFPNSGEIARCYNTDEMRHPITSLIQDAEGVSNSVSVYNNPAIKLTVSNISTSKYLGFYITVSTAASSSTVYTGVITLDARF